MRKAGRAVNAALVVTMSLGSAYTSGQNFPNKPIRIVSGVAGGSSDIPARLIAPHLSDALGQPIVVENRSGVLSADIASKAIPDGYTLLAIGNSGWIQPLFQKVPYDMKDLVPVTTINRNVLIVAVHPAVPAQSIKELVALAKAKPGTMNVSHSGAGGPAHLALELFKFMAGINVVSVPYKGGAPALTALMAGEVQMLINTASQLMPQVKTGKIKGLAVTSLTPSVLAPGLPTVADSGMPGYQAIGVTVCLVANNTPAWIIDRLNQALVRVLNQQRTRDQFVNAGTEAVTSTPAEAASFIRSDTETVRKLIKEGGLKTNE